MKNKQNKIEELQRKMLYIMGEMGNLANEYRNLDLQRKKLKSELVTEVRYSNYLDQRDDKSGHNSYDIISLKVASFLKEKGIPVKAKEIHIFLTEEKYHTISYTNLQNNYLPRMNQDNNINVERAYRGFWQYRNQIRRGSQ